MEAAKALMIQASTLYNRLRAKSGQKLSESDQAMIQECLRQIEIELNTLKEHFVGDQSDEKRLQTLVQRNRTS